MIKLTQGVVAVIEAVLVTSICAYQYTLPECPMDAVCSEISALSSGSSYEQLYFPVQKCKCPSDMYCPTEPGSQTISVNKDRWYGLCRQVSDIKTCQRGEVAEEILVSARHFGDRSYTTVRCTCPSHLYPESLSDGGRSTLLTYTKDNDIRAKLVHQFICMEGNIVRNSCTSSSVWKMEIFSRREVTVGVEEDFTSTNVPGEVTVGVGDFTSADVPREYFSFSEKLPKEDKNTYSFRHSYFETKQFFCNIFCKYN